MPYIDADSKIRYDEAMHGICYWTSNTFKNTTETARKLTPLINASTVSTFMTETMFLYNNFSHQICNTWSQTKSTICICAANKALAFISQKMRKKFSLELQVCLNGRERLSVTE